MRSSVNEFKYLEYLGSVILLANLDKREIFIADSNMLSHPKFGNRKLYGTLSGTHPIPYLEYIRIGYFLWRHDSLTVNRVVSICICFYG
jgi:hypothetical protein